MSKYNVGLIWKVLYFKIPPSKDHPDTHNTYTADTEVSQFSGQLIRIRSTVLMIVTVVAAVAVSFTDFPVLLLLQACAIDFYFDFLYWTLCMLVMLATLF